MQPNVPATLVRLPGGISCEAVVHSIDGSLLHLVLSEPAEHLAPGVLVEVQTTPVTWFGEIRTIEDLAVCVNVEHTLNRPQVQQLRQRWR